LDGHGNVHPPGHVNAMSSDHREVIPLEAQGFEGQGHAVDETAYTVKMDDDEQTAKSEPKKQERKEPVDLIREPGRSLLPFARVQKIIKADKVSSGNTTLVIDSINIKEIPVVAKEATFLISLATEEFIKHLCQAAHHVAQKDKRTTVQHRDIGEIQWQNH
jgi:histone H3/H4